MFRIAKYKSLLLTLLVLLATACGAEVPEPTSQATEALLTDVSCSLAVSLSDVTFPGSTEFQIDVTGTLPPGAQAFWNGTKDGRVDAVDEPTYKPYAAGKFPILYIDPSLAGHYVRYAVIKDAAGHPLCQTGAVSVVFRPIPPVTCSLTASSILVPPDGSTTLTIHASGTPVGAAAFWSGTHDGVPDAIGSPTVPLVASGSFPIMSSPGIKGVYSRWAEIKDGFGHILCTTGSVTVTFL